VSTAFIGLGANLGDRSATLSAALDRLDRVEGIRVVTRSSFHETAPVGGPAGQPMYLNAAAKLETTLEPHALLSVLQQIELEFGRQRLERWGPRTLDLDLLLYDSLVIETPELTLPHPLMHERPFVLAPLAEIAPEGHSQLL